MPLHYIVREPKKVLESNPAIVLLHGYGSNEEDLFSFAPELPEDYYIISVRAPHSLMHGSYAWFSINFDANATKFSDLGQARESRDLIVSFLEEITLKYPINKNNINLIGFSQGAILSYAIALSYPEKINKVIALSGYLNQEIIVEGFDKLDHSKLKMYVSHGTVDQVIPIDWANKAPAFLANRNIDVTYKEYPIGHGVSPQNFYDFKNWLLNN